MGDWIEKGMTNFMAFFFGICIGSFINACAYRLPRGLSITHGRSRCSKCKTSLHWYDNVPLISCLFLFGRCRHCGSTYGFYHFWIELLLGLFAVWILSEQGLSLQSVYIYFLFSILVLMSIIDFEFRIIPDELTILGFSSGLLMALLHDYYNLPWNISFKGAVLSACVGFIALWSLSKLFLFFTGHEGLGFGDVKLMAMFGAHQGIHGMISTVFVASVSGVVYWTLLMLQNKVKRKTPIAFGPFLSFGFILDYMLDFNFFSKFEKVISLMLQGS